MSTGQCEFGSICQYAHGDAELKVNKNNNSSKLINYNSSFLANNQFNSPQFKTILCKNYEETGKCEFASKCQFAHGKSSVDIGTLSTRSSRSQESWS